MSTHRNDGFAPWIQIEESPVSARREMTNVKDFIQMADLNSAINFEVMRDDSNTRCQIDRITSLKKIKICANETEEPVIQFFAHQARE